MPSRLAQPPWLAIGTSLFAGSSIVLGVEELAGTEADEVRLLAAVSWAAWVGGFVIWASALAAREPNRTTAWLLRVAALVQAGLAVPAFYFAWRGTDSFPFRELSFLSSPWLLVAGLLAGPPWRRLALGFMALAMATPLPIQAYWFDLPQGAWVACMYFFPMAGGALALAVPWKSWSRN